jgi:hypothetical protein
MTTKIFNGLKPGAVLRTPEHLREKPKKKKSSIVFYCVFVFVVVYFGYGLVIPREYNLIGSHIERKVK